MRISPSTEAYYSVCCMCVVYCLACTLDVKGLVACIACFLASEFCRFGRINKALPHVVGTTWNADCNRKRGQAALVMLGASSASYNLVSEPRKDGKQGCRARSVLGESGSQKHKRVIVEELERFFVSCLN